MNVFLAQNSKLLFQNSYKHEILNIVLLSNKLLYKSTKNNIFLSINQKINNIYNNLVYICNHIEESILNKRIIKILKYKIGCKCGCIK